MPAIGEQALQSSNPITEHGIGRWQWWAVCISAGALAIGYLQARNSFARDSVLSIAAGTIVVMALWPRLIGRARAAARVFGIFAVAVVLAASLTALVNKKYLKATAGELPRSEAFRGSLRLTHWPVWGRSEFSRWPHALVAFPAAGLLAYWAVGHGRRLALERDRPTAALAGLCAASAVTMVAFAFSERPDRWAAVFSFTRQFRADARHFSTVCDLLSNYRARMDELSWFGRHYPPGNALVLGWLDVAGKYLFVMGAAASPALVWLANRSLGATKVTGWWSAALVAVAPVVLMQATISTTVQILPLSAAGLWLIGVCLVRPIGASLIAAAALALVLAVWSFFSFSLPIYLLMVAIALALWIAAGHADWRRVAACTIGVGFMLVLLLTLLWLATGYDTLATFREATSNHFEQIGGRKIPPADPVGRWLLRSMGNVVAFAFGHLPLVAAGLLAVPLARRSTSPIALLMPATIVVVLLAGFSGTFTIETDRIWMFLVPPVALAGGYWLARCQDPDAPVAVVIFSLCLGLAIELTFWPYL